MQNVNACFERLNVILSIVLKIRDEVDRGLGTQMSVKWLKEHLLVKLSKWSEEKDLNTENTSLKLVCVHKYSVLYQHLKTKYGQELVKVAASKIDLTVFFYSIFVFDNQKVMLRVFLTYSIKFHTQ